jgi:hypothetical protein
MKISLCTFLAVGLFSVPAFAGGSVSGSVLVDSQPADYTSTGSAYSNPLRVDGFKFELNPSLGRARLDIDYTDDQSHVDDVGPGENDVLVQGLSYDAAAKQVIYTDARGTKTICANGEHKGVFGTFTAKTPTGNCALRSEVVTQTTDDGFEQHQSRVLNVYLDLKN